MSALLFDLPPPEAKPIRRTRKPVNQAPKHSDHFQTPATALDALLPYLPDGWSYWEPACGQGNLVRGLNARGRLAFGTDLITGHDFLTHDSPKTWDALVTNPPFSVKDAWIARCYELGKPFALLLPFTVLEGQVRQALYRQHGVELLILPKRVNFQTPNDCGSSAWFPTAWVTWRLGLPSALTFSEVLP